MMTRRENMTMYIVNDISVILRYKMDPRCEKRSVELSVQQYPLASMAAVSMSYG